MVAVCCAFMLVSLPFVTVVGLIGDEKCSVSYLNPRQHSLRWRVAAQYFWLGLGLALALWLLFLSFALWNYGITWSSNHGFEEQLYMTRDVNRIAGGLICVGAGVHILCVVVGRSARRTYCTQPLWRVISVYTVALAAVVALVREAFTFIGSNGSILFHMKLSLQSLL